MPVQFMEVESQYTIVVPDSDLLYRICGTNDSNLRLIENHLGVPVFVNGNEISVPGSDEDVADEFKHILNRILDEASDGSEPCSDMINSILQTAFNNESFDEKEFFNRAVIRIPGGVRTIYPKTKKQADLIYSMRKNTLVFASGPAGSGKTFLAVAEALCQLISQKKRNLVLTRPVVEAGESLGFLPGDYEQKLNPYLRPLFDALEALLPRELLRKMLESGIIEIAPLAYMRGRTLSDSIIILDEAQNTTVQQMKMFLTRIGENSKVFVTGDVTQSDLPKRFGSGLVNALEILDGIEDIGVCHLDEEDIVRSPLVRKIIKAYEKAESAESAK